VNQLQTLQFNKVVEQIGLTAEEKQLVKNAVMERPTFIVNRRILRISLKNDRPLPFLTWKKIQDGLIKLTHSNVELQILCEPVKIEIKEVEQYVRYYSGYIQNGRILNDTYLNMVNLEIECLCPLPHLKDDIDLLLPDLNVFLSQCGIHLPIRSKIVERNGNSIEVDMPVSIPKPVETKKDYKEFRRKKRSYTLVKIKDIMENMNDIEIEGTVFQIENRDIMGGEQMMQLIYLSDDTDSISVKRYARKAEEKEEFKNLSNGDVIVVKGRSTYDQYAKDVVLLADDITFSNKTVSRSDDAVFKRVEWHAHSKMSEMDGVCDIEEMVETAFSLGHPGLAITDHMVVQSFPKAQYTVSRLKKQFPDHPFKMIYGVEMNMVDPLLKIVSSPKGQILEEMTVVAFDLETTGLSSRYDEIIEFGAVKIRYGEVIDRLQFYVKPKGEIPLFISEKTNIRQEHVEHAKTIAELMPRILEFFADHVLVAHNAGFDVRFINENLQRLNMKVLSNTVIDTLDCARALIKDRKAFKLGKVARYYAIPYDEEVAHRADYDAEIAGMVIVNLLKDARDKNCKTVEDLQNVQDADVFKSVMKKHVNVIAKNQAGLKSLFELVTLSHTDYLAFFGKANSKKDEDEFMAEPRIIRAEIIARRNDLLIGSSCYNGEIFEIAANQSHEELIQAMKFYDYIEVQPPANYQPLIDQHSIASRKRLITILNDIINTAEKLSIPVLATGDAHYANPEQKQFREIYIQAQGIGGVRHPLYIYNAQRRSSSTSPDQHLRTTEEMLEAFSFLDDKTAFDIVVENTRSLLDKVKEVYPIQKGLYTPSIDGADAKLSEVCYKNAYKRYGKTLPKPVEDRLAKELTAIISNGFGVIYYIAHLLVKKSLEDGYLVGSRGSVGSSLVATMAEITEVNPLPPHYSCPQCSYSEFFFDGKVSSGYDLPDKFCPHCATLMQGDGQDIPFETFLGFEGDKVPDIDLNFSGDYQEKAHAYTKVLFGEDNVYRAGTIGTVAQKTAFGYVSGYCEEKGIDANMRQAQRIRLASGCEGVKRTTGQHPGGIIVIPRDVDVHQFTPVQYPANNPTSEWKTTHFDYNDLHDNLLKLDILGHVDPTAIKLLEKVTGIDPKTIPMNDFKVISVFSDLSTLNIDSRNYTEANGAVGLPEFGTSFVREILKITRPQTFSDLVRISGLSHGTDVWLNNAKDLILNGYHLSDVIGCRDDIMVYLIQKGLKPKQAFDIMEFVRKGKGLKPEWEELMLEHKIDQWYIDSCKRIKYMFPKAHAVAYVIMAVRVAWFKVYHPLAYYVSYFTLRCNAYDIDVMRKGSQAILARLTDIDKRMRDNSTKFQVTNKEKDLYNTLEVALEMTLRGYRFDNIDLRLSLADEFLIHPRDSRVLIPPFKVLDGLGDNVARSIVDAREKCFFLSKEDLQSRTQINGTQVRKLEIMGVLDDLQDENQLSLF
jgi:DNA polymerase III subunit alpha, Gram-positive type